ncbi:gamma carbonic anhydrase family protein [soil metagenome]
MTKTRAGPRVQFFAMATFKLDQHSPDIDATAYVDESARLIGQVVLGRRVSVWSYVVIRGDNEPIRIGDDSNVQEGVVMHTDRGQPLTIGTGVTIGHQAMLHGCTVGDNCLIGIKATVLNGAVIGRDCLVGAGALVTERKTFPDGSLIIGTPAKVARALTDQEIEGLRASARSYAERGAWFATSMTRVG